MSLPKRKFLPHAVPGWVEGCPIFFITICALQRGENQFCHPVAAKAIFEATAFYHQQARWHVHLMLIMPDHVHALISFPKVESIEQVVRSWKHYLAKQHKLKWQRDYFDHRLRNHESHREKADYIRLNPVRAGLVSDPALWPFIWEP
jgi:REP element-mobilizing transposase RayT